ncbi:MAG: cation transporter [Acidobacteriaceae bacterium]|nr:cation transporter [Acidobacteriaceae bacterium]MBV8570626.1 cation transporter [Acidobacteriaceae bacterium]
MLAPSGLSAGNTLERVGRRIALLSITIGVGLAIAKVLVGIRAGSVSLVSDGLEAAGDALSSAIVYAGLWLASKPPDFEHPYGHGRYETLAGLAVGGMLLLTGAGILWHGLTSLSEPSVVARYALYPLFAAIVLKVFLAVSKLRVGKRLQSTSLQADAWHDITDLLSTTVALIAVALTIANPHRFANADRAGGIVIGGIILFLAIRVVRRTVGQLLDTMPEPDRMHEIREVALSVPGALGIEKCFARRTGLKYHVDLHLEVDPDLTVRTSHEIAARVRTAIRDTLSWVADVLVHVEPSPSAPLSTAPRGLLKRRHGK